MLKVWEALDKTNIAQAPKQFAELSALYF